MAALLASRRTFPHENSMEARLEEDIARVASNVNSEEVVRLFLSTTDGQEVDMEAAHSELLFVALFRGLPTALFSAVFLGDEELTLDVSLAENGIEDGARLTVEIFNECDFFQHFCTGDENDTPLLIQTPNRRDKVGFYRDGWILNPAANLVDHQRQLQLLGQFVGIALQTAATLPEMHILHPVFWKRLTGAELSPADLETFDDSTARSMKAFRELHDNSTFTEEDFDMMFFELTFTTPSSASTSKEPHILELKPNGGAIDVTYWSIGEFCDLAVEARLHESDAQLALVKQGLSMIGGTEELLSAPEEIEREVCGAPIIFDIDVLRNHTEYCNGLDELSESVRFFWAALESFNEQDRSAFVRFALGQSRLPAKEADWDAAEAASGYSLRMKLSQMGDSRPDGFPIRGTSYFEVKLPRYTTAEICKGRLLYAIRNAGRL